MIRFANCIFFTDCNYLCHKRCHVSVDSQCPSSSYSSMVLEHIPDPKQKSRSMSRLNGKLANLDQQQINANDTETNEAANSVSQVPLAENGEPVNDKLV